MNRSNRTTWRWAERDFGFRFLSGSGKRLAEYYQANRGNEFYHVPASQRKLNKDRIDEVATLVLMLPFDRHQRDRDQARYYAACEAARTRFDYQPLSDLFRLWQEEAQEHFLDQEGDHA